MQKLIFSLLTLISLNGIAQTLQPIIEKHHIGSITPLALDYINDVLWVSGYQRDSEIGIIWKYDHFGNLIDSIVLSENTPNSIYEFKQHGDSILALGTQKSGDTSQLVIHCLSQQLELYWTKTVNLDYRPAILSFRTFDFNNQKIIHIRSPYSHFFKFDKNYNLLYEKNIGFPYNFEPLYTTQQGFIFIKWGLYIVEVNSIFQEVDTLNYNSSGYYGRTGNMMSLGRNKYISNGPEINDIKTITYWDSAFEKTNTYSYFGSETELGIPRFTYFQTLLYNSDTSRIYFSGFLDYNQEPHVVDLGSYNTNKFWVAYGGRDSLLWYKFYKDAINYYLTTNMTLGPDGSLYVAASRYNVLEQPEYSDAVIFRFSKEGELLVGEPNGVTQTIDPKIYPNPGKGYLQIKIANYSDATIQLYDLQGKIVQVDNFTHNTRLSTENLNEGIYFYRITTNKGTVYNGKWIKR